MFLFNYFYSPPPAHIFAQIPRDVLPKIFENLAKLDINKVYDTLYVNMSLKYLRKYRASVNKFMEEYLYLLKWYKLNDITVANQLFKISVERFDKFYIQGFQMDPSNIENAILMGHIKSKENDWKIFCRMFLFENDIVLLYSVDKEPCIVVDIQFKPKKRGYLVTLKLDSVQNIDTFCDEYDISEPYGEYKIKEVEREKCLLSPPNLQTNLWWNI